MSHIALLFARNTDENVFKFQSFVQCCMYHFLCDFQFHLDPGATPPEMYSIVNLSPGLGYDSSPIYWDLDFDLNLRPVDLD